MLCQVRRETLQISITGLFPREGDEIAGIDVLVNDTAEPHQAPVKADTMTGKGIRAECVPKFREGLTHETIEGLK